MLLGFKKSEFLPILETSETWLISKLYCQKIDHCACGDRRAWCMVVSGQQVIWAAGVYQQQQQRAARPKNPQHSPNSVGIQQNTVLQCKWAVSSLLFTLFFILTNFFHQDFKIIKIYYSRLIKNNTNKFDVKTVKKKWSVISVRNLWKRIEIERICGQKFETKKKMCKNSAVVCLCEER